ncbi:MAG: glycosyltransferase family 2 protein, partial [Bacteroidales bacterium]|nr:glycosyltransferase family 2 protein [Bacteroidales bacterium]
MALPGNRLFPDLIREEPSADTGIIAVVPAFNEPGITNLLDSLASCIPPECRVEIIIVINAPPGASQEAMAGNALTREMAEKWRSENRNPFFTLHLIDIGRANHEKWGVGMARKTGMDEALSRFTRTGRTDGVILSLDADCTVEKNYFTEIEKELLNEKKRKGCSIYFEHPLSGNEFPPEVYSAAAIYELHLRYFFQALKYTGYPWVHHTVGSCFAVKACAYRASGGMNRRQAGEDFYFIQKLLPAGGYFNLNSTTVYPSPRRSDRVPFGTGAVVSEITDSGQESFNTYNPGAFSDLKKFFALTTGSYDHSGEMILETYELFPASLKEFLTLKTWTENA